MVGLDSPRPRRLGIEGEDGDAIAEQLLEPLHEGGGLARRLLHRLPPVLVVHVEDEVDGAVVMDESTQGQPRQERLARTGLAEDTVGTLGKTHHVDADFRVHVEGGADAEVLALGVPLFAEDA